MDLKFAKSRLSFESINILLGNTSDNIKNLLNVDNKKNSIEIQKQIQEANQDSDTIYERKEKKRTQMLELVASTLKSREFFDKARKSVRSQKFFREKEPFIIKRRVNPTPIPCIFIKVLEK